MARFMKFLGGLVVMTISFGSPAKTASASDLFPFPSPAPPLSRTSVALAPDPTSPARAGRRGWQVRLVAESRTHADAGNVVGQHPRARDGLDRYDRLEPPPKSNSYLSILFENPEFPPVKWGFTRDLRALSEVPRGEWLFTVRASEDQHLITLSWRGNPAALNVGWLIDLTTDVWVPTLPGGSYTYWHGEKDREFIFAIFQR